jgi:hypothetical protein
MTTTVECFNAWNDNSVQGPKDNNPSALGKCLLLHSIEGSKMEYRWEYKRHTQNLGGETLCKAIAWKIETWQHNIKMTSHEYIC